MNYKKQQGFLLIVAVLLIVIIGFLGIALAQIFFVTSFATTDASLASKALYLAQAGIEYGTHKVVGPTIANRHACSGLSVSNTLDGNAYSVTSTGPFYVSSPTTVSGALNATATTIPVGSTSNYQASGRIMIDGELISYDSTNSTNFLGATRGVDGSIATAHVSGTAVGQYQCNLTGQGGVPSLTAPANAGYPSGKRIVIDQLQLQEGWAVGNASGGVLTFIRWNNPTEVQWNSATVAGTLSLTDITMNSYVDGWAVGSSGTFYHWNGSTWSAVATGLSGKSYSGIYCTAANYCNAVGGKAGFGFWNGTSWVDITPSGSNPGTKLTKVHCDPTNHCWVVGDDKGGGVFYSGSGSPIAWVGIAESGLSAYTYNDVFCNSATDCWAVGANATFARLNGAAWANFATGLPTVQYNAVFCNSSSDCWAVGNASSNDVIAHWNGTSWSLNSSNPTPVANLNTVACTNANDCWAAGGAGATPVFVHWDGNNWVNVSTSGLPGVAINKLVLMGPKTQPLSVWQENFG